ncbi:MAG TPA: LPXTG cell wall anchor domain-containing protein [Bacillus bacterium]|nr:LPXTG cell wall anchor domain-containing protein [Bacillus sp. (in: firmicutes)]
MKSLKILFTLMTVIIIFCSNSLIINAEENKELDIGVTPDRFLFEISNMKPGDLAKRKLTVQNLGKRDFTYNTAAEFIGGSKKLYEEFLLKVSDSNGILHEGNLKDFKGLKPRFLKSKHEEDLLFELEFPYELGNEFQGLAFEVEFKFIVEGYDPPSPGGGGGGGSGGGSDNPNNPSNPTPGEASGPDNQGTPGVLGDPEEPKNPIVPEDPDKINPQQPIDPKKLNSTPVGGHILPATATNIYNFGFAGIVLLLVGSHLFFIQRKKKQVVKQ